MRYLKYFMIAAFTCVVTLSVDEVRIARSCEGGGVTHVAGQDYFCADWNATVEVFRRLKAGQAKGPTA